MKRTILAVVCTSVLTALIMGQGKNRVPKVIEAERFELVDAAGELRGFLGMMPDGDVALEIHGGSGCNVILSAAAGEAAIIVGSGEYTSALFADSKRKRTDRKRRI